LSHQQRHTRFSKCKVCNSEKIKVKLHIKDADIFKCSDCKAYITDNSNFAGDNLYNDVSYFEGERKIIRAKDNNNFDSYFPFINLIKSKLENKKNVNFLEIGPGGGDFSLAAQKTAWNVYCLDVSDIVIENLKTIGIAGSTFNGNEFSLNNKFDTVVMKHVLEHIEHPRSIIESIYNVLDDDGLVYIQVPNSLSFDRFYHRKKWSGWDIPYHLVHYNYSSLKTLLGVFGMKIIYSDFTFFNPIRHIKNGLKNKDMFGDYRSYKSNNAPAIEKPVASVSGKDENPNPSKIKKIIKTIFSERDIIIIAKKAS
jgi:SAM-dependent methyltransferase